MTPRRRTATILVALCLGHILLISSQVSARNGSSVLSVTSFGAMARLQSAFSGLTGWVGGLWSHYVWLGGVSRENEALKTRVVGLEAELQAERARSARVDSLEDALNLRRSQVAPSLAARVIAGNPVPGVMTVNLDRGTADGVRANMPVINGHGVVGRVIGSPSAHACTVQLLSDRAASAGAMLEKSGTAGSLSAGHADGLFRIELISSATDLAVGERVFTSGQDGIYPQGFIIGQVAQINGTGKAREIVITPAVDFARLDVVLVLLRRHDADKRP